MRLIELNQSFTSSNEKDAEDLRTILSSHGVTMINLMSAAGSGKTTFLCRTLADLSDQLRIGVLEADIDSTVDAETVESYGAAAVQVHTDGMCHMDAGMTKASIDPLDLDSLDIIFLENVGNLICPAEYDTGSHLKVMILSVPEGDDKPLKYPLMFQESDALIISKIDTMDYFDFDMEKCITRAKKLNPDIVVFPVSAKTGEGMNEWESWLITAVSNNK